MSALEEIVFTGDGGALECQNFIRSVRQHALSEGKSRDPDWVADFAGACFAGEALMWYEDLDDRTQLDWKLLRRALLDKYVVLGDESSRVPTPAAAPPITSISGIGQARRGRLRVIADDPRANGYLSRSITAIGFYKGLCVVATSPSDAMQIQYTPSFGPHKIALLNPSITGDWLGLAWFKPDPTFGCGSPSYAALAPVVGSDEPPNRPSLGPTWNGPIQTAIWNISPEGLLCATMATEDGASHALDAAVFEIGYGGSKFVEFASDCQKFASVWTDSCRARIVFERIQ